MTLLGRIYLLCLVPAIILGRQEESCQNQQVSLQFEVVKTALSQLLENKGCSGHAKQKHVDEIKQLLEEHMSESGRTNSNNLTAKTQDMEHPAQTCSCDTQLHNDDTLQLQDADNTTFLYLDGTKIIHLATWKVLACIQEIPKEPYGSSAAMVSYKGKDTLLVCGGVGGRKGTCLAWLDNGWEKTNFEFMREFAASSMLSDGGWLVTGGWIPGRQTDTAQLYAGGDQWVQYPSLPVNISHHCQVTVGTKVYTVGGTSDGGWSSHPMDSVYVTDVSEKDRGWTRLPFRLAERRAKHSCAVLDGKIYVIGGYTMFDYFSSVEVFDTNYPAAWTRGPDFPTPLSEPHAFVYRDTLYVIGGHGANYAHNTNVYKLARSGKEWTIVKDVHVDNPAHDVHPAPLIHQDALHCKDQ